jgi:apolipoprotein D and lipocalin family protein
MPRVALAAALGPLILASALLAGSAVRAGPPTPVVAPQAAMDTDRIMGRWYEILRMPNKIQRNCFAAYQVWAKKDDGYTVQQVCHRDSPDGRVAEVTVTAKPLNPENTMFDTSFFGGLIHQKYVLLDHAPDYSWLISTTADGRFPKLMYRSPDMPAAEQAVLKQRLARLGFDVSRMEFCGAQTAG